MAQGQSVKGLGERDVTRLQKIMRWAERQMANPEQFRRRNAATGGGGGGSGVRVGIITGDADGGGYYTVMPQSLYAGDAWNGDYKDVFIDTPGAAAITVLNLHEHNSKSCLMYDEDDTRRLLMMYWSVCDKNGGATRYVGVAMPRYYSC